MDTRDGSGRERWHVLPPGDQADYVPGGLARADGDIDWLQVFSRFAVSLPQHDRCWAMLTCREHVSLAVDFFQASSSASERKAATESLLADLGLVSCANTIAGNELIARDGR